MTETLSSGLMYLHIIKEDELPSMEMSPYSNVHVLNRGPLQPTTGFFQRLYPPHTGSPIEPKEIEKNSIHLLLHLEMKG